MGWLNDAVHWVEHAGKDAVDWTEQAAKDAGHWTERAAEDVGHGFNDAGKAIGEAAKSAWKATSDEANAIASGVEAAGITIGNGFIAGATTVGKAIEEGAEQTGKGLVDAAKYVSEYACDIAVGSALSAAFAALAADGEEEAATGSLAAICAAQTIDNVALNTAAKTLAYIVVEPIYAIPGVSHALGHKSDVESLVAFLTFKVCKENPKVVVGTAGQYLAGALIYGLTSAICEGKIPGGFTVWKGAQSEITG